MVVFVNLPVGRLETDNLARHLGVIHATEFHPMLVVAINFAMFPNPRRSNGIGINDMISVSLEKCNAICIVKKVDHRSYISDWDICMLHIIMLIKVDVVITRYFMSILICTIIVFISCYVILLLFLSFVFVVVFIFVVAVVCNDFVNQ